jgi:hypothetical protein
MGPAVAVTTNNAKTDAKATRQARLRLLICMIPSKIDRSLDAIAAGFQQ